MLLTLIFSQKLVYYDTDRSGIPIKFMSSSSLFTSVEDAASGKSPYKNSENFVERLARVCFCLILFIPRFIESLTFTPIFRSSTTSFTSLNTILQITHSNRYSSPSLLLLRSSISPTDLLVGKPTQIRLMNGRN